MGKAKEPHILAVIPARGGSKGIARKNVQLVGGVPLVARTVRAALDCRTVNRVVVSTDDDEIARISRSHGAEVVIRPASLSGDEASSESAVLHALDVLYEKGYSPVCTVMLQCTSPFTHPDDIDGTVRLVTESGADTALAVTSFHGFLWKQDGGGNAVGVNHSSKERARRQDRMAEYLETGSVYAMDTKGFLVARHRFFGHTSVHVVPQDRSLEIDEPRDLANARRLGRDLDEPRAAALPSGGVQALILDFDGVFTNNKVYLDADGKETVRCDRSDGLGLDLLKNRGTRILVISSEKNPVVQARASKLGIECIHGVIDKATHLAGWLEKEHVDPDRAVYVGNDENDLSAMRMVGCSVAVADAHECVLAQASIILKRAGGNGAIREICDMFLKKLPGEE